MAKSSSKKVTAKPEAKEKKSSTIEPVKPAKTSPPLDKLITAEGWKRMMIRKAKGTKKS